MPPKTEQSTLSSNSPLASGNNNPPASVSGLSVSVESTPFTAKVLAKKYESCGNGKITSKDDVLAQRSLEEREKFEGRPPGEQNLALEDCKIERNIVDEIDVEPFRELDKKNEPCVDGKTISKEAVLENLSFEDQKKFESLPPEEQNRFLEHERRKIVDEYSRIQQDLASEDRKIEPGRDAELIGLFRPVARQKKRQILKVVKARAYPFLASTSDWKPIAQGDLKLLKVGLTPIMSGCLSEIVTGLNMLANFDCTAEELLNTPIGGFTVRQWRVCTEEVLAGLSSRSKKERASAASAFNQWVKRVESLQGALREGDLVGMSSKAEEIVPDPVSRKLAISLLSPACNWKKTFTVSDIAKQFYGKEGLHDIIAGLVVISKFGVESVREQAQTILSRPIAGITLKELGEGGDTLCWLEDALSRDVTQATEELNRLARDASVLHDRLNRIEEDESAPLLGDQKQPPKKSAADKQGFQLALDSADKLVHSASVLPGLNVTLSSKEINNLHNDIVNRMVTENRICDLVKTRGDVLLVRELALSLSRVSGPGLFTNTKKITMADALSSIVLAKGDSINVNPGVILDGLYETAQKVQNVLMDKGEAAPPILQLIAKELTPYLGARGIEDCTCILKLLSGNFGGKIRSILTSSILLGGKTKLLIGTALGVLDTLRVMLRDKTGMPDLSASRAPPPEVITPLELAAAARIGADLQPVRALELLEEPSGTLLAARAGLRKAGEWKSQYGRDIKALPRRPFIDFFVKNKNKDFRTNNGGGLTNVIAALKILKEQGTDIEKQRATHLLASKIGGLSVVMWGDLNPIVTNWIKYATPEEREQAASELNKLARVAASIGALSKNELEGHQEVQSNNVEVGYVKNDFQVENTPVEIKLTSRMDSLIDGSSCEEGGWEIVQKHSEYKNIENGFSLLGDAEKWECVDGGDLLKFLSSHLSLFSDDNLTARRTKFSQENGGGLLNICMGIDEIRRSGYGASKAMAEILSERKIVGFSGLQWGSLDKDVMNWIRGATVEQRITAARDLNEFVVNAATLKNSFNDAYVTY